MTHLTNKTQLGYALPVAGKIQQSGLDTRTIHKADTPAAVIFPAVLLYLHIMAYALLYFSWAAVWKAFGPAGFLVYRLSNPHGRPFCVWTRRRALPSYTRSNAMPNHATAVSSLEPVSFRNDTIYAIEYNGEAYTPLRPIVENMGLDWKSQSVKLQSNKKRF